MSKNKMTLYDNPVSFSSQVVRFVLAEKGIPFKERLMDVGPALQNYDPWYLKINLRGVVPTLVDDDRIVCDSLRIARYLEGKSDVDLFPSDPELRDQVEEWLDDFDKVPERILPYIALEGGQKKFLMWDLRRRIRVLAFLAKSQIAMRRAYQDKLADMKKLAADLEREDIKLATITDVKAFLATVEDQLSGGQSYLFGEKFTTADVILGVYMARLRLLKLDAHFKDCQHKHLNAWYERVQSRPAFEEANVGMSAKGSGLLLSLARAYFPAFVLILFMGYMFCTIFS